MLVAILASLLLVGCRPDPPKALDLAGNPVDPFVSRASVVVLLFVQIDCPISNRYAPTIARLHARFESQGVAFYLVYPDRREDADAIRRHGREYGLPGQALRDVQHALVKRVGASVTPEAVVLGARGNVVYRGPHRRPLHGLRPSASAADPQRPCKRSRGDPCWSSP